MVRTQDRVSTRFRNPSGRGESDVIVYRGRAEATIVSFSSWPQGFLSRGEMRSNCLTVLEPMTPTDGVAWRVVDKLGVISPSVLASLQTLFLVGFACQNWSLELATTGKAHLLELGMKWPPSRKILSRKPRSNLPRKESSARMGLWITAWMMLKWMICWWWVAKCPKLRCPTY